MSQTSCKSRCSLVPLTAEGKLLNFDDVQEELYGEAHNLIQGALDTSKPQEFPRLIHLCGIPGSGKTTYANHFVLNNPEYSMVQFDEVMEKLSGYRNAKNRCGLSQAFFEWELPARAIGYHLFQALVEGSRSIIFDHSASSILHLELIDSVKKRGYRVEMHYLVCPPEIALKRVQEREKIIQRHTPENLIWERVELLEKLTPLYRQKVDRFIEINTSPADVQK
jgi:predicted ABC-type ATPase